MHEFISTIFYTFMRAIPLALVALVIGVIILVMVTLKYRREGRKFPKSQAVGVDPSTVLPGRVNCYYVYESF